MLNKGTAGILSETPHGVTPLARMGRGQDLRDTPDAELRDLRRRVECIPVGQQETTALAGAPRRFDRIGQRAGVAHRKSLLTAAGSTSAVL